MLRKGAPHYKMLGGSPHHNAWRTAPLADRSARGPLRWRIAPLAAGDALRWRTAPLADRSAGELNPSPTIVGDVRKALAPRGLPKCPALCKRSASGAKLPNSPNNQTPRQPRQPNNPTKTLAGHWQTSKRANQTLKTRNNPTT